MTRHRDIVAAWAGWHTQGRPSTRRLRWALVGFVFGLMAGYFVR